MILALIGACMAGIGTIITGPTWAGNPKAEDAGMADKLVKSEAAWGRQLSPEQVQIQREKGTELAFSGKYHNHKAEGIFVCAACGQTLFSSSAKFDSRTGWPSYWQPIDASHILTKSDRSLFMRRTEVLCSRCEGHLGHVFKDGPEPTGLRYCINAVALDFVPKP
jgi:peptide-methionine (R)-S-oxide reductase